MERCARKECTAAIASGHAWHEDGKAWHEACAPSARAAEVAADGIDFSVELPRGQGRLSVDLVLDQWPPVSVDLCLVREGEDDRVVRYTRWLERVLLQELRRAVLEARSSASDELTRAHANGLVTALHIVEGLHGEPDLI